MLYCKCTNKNNKNWIEPREIKNGERAFIIINVIKKEKYGPWTTQNYFEKYTKNPKLGNFILCNRDLISVGNIYDINVKDKSCFINCILHLSNIKILF